MKLVFSKHQEFAVAEQALNLLASERAVEQEALIESLVAKGWQKIKDYEYVTENYQWVVHPSVAALDWQDDCFDPKEEGVDSELYYDLY